MENKSKILNAVEGACFELIVQDVRIIHDMVDSDERNEYFHIFTVLNENNYDWPTVFTIKGNLPYLKMFKGEVIEFNPSHKWKQVTFKGRKQSEYTLDKDDVFVKRIPADEIAIAKFIQNSVHGVGPKMAKKIVDVKKADTVNFLANATIDDLDDAYPFLKEEMKQTLCNHVNEYVGYHQMVMFLMYHQCDTHHAKDLWRKYRYRANTILRDNALLLASTIGLKEAMDIFHHANQHTFYDIIDHNNDKSITKNLKKNHGYMEKLVVGLTVHGLEMCETSKQYTAINTEMMYDGIMRLIEQVSPVAEYAQYVDFDFYVKSLKNNGTLFEVKDEVLALKKLAKLEIEINNVIKAMNRPNEYCYIPGGIDDQIGDFFNAGQREAIKRCLTNQVSILTGGAGVGKTTTIGEILRLIKKDHQLRPRLYAPTGKAASRMSEATGEEARTLQSLTFAIENDLHPKHRPSEKQREEGKYWRNVYIVDEFSMVDIFVFSTFLRFLDKSNDILIIVGDDNQLPSIGPGSLLRDFVKYLDIPTTKLDVTVRQDESSIDLAKFIDDVQYHKGADLTFRTSNSLDIYDVNNINIKEIVDLFVDFAKKGELDETMLLTPMNKYETGTEYLNNQIRELINPGNIGLEEITYHKHIYREKDRVMQTINRGSLTNGMVGYIYGAYISVDENNKQHHVVEVKYKELDEVVLYSGSEIDELKLAYAITVHKSQGSEYKNIIMLIDRGHNVMLNHGLLYTGITRAKGKLFLYIDQATFRSGIDNTTNLKRFTWIQETAKLEA